MHKVEVPCLWSMHSGLFNPYPRSLISYLDVGAQVPHQCVQPQNEQSGDIAVWREERGVKKCHPTTERLLPSAVTSAILEDDQAWLYKVSKNLVQLPMNAYVGAVDLTVFGWSQEAPRYLQCDSDS